MAYNLCGDIDQPSTSNVNYDDDYYFDNAPDSDDSGDDFTADEDEESDIEINSVWCNTTAGLKDVPF